MNSCAVFAISKVSLTLSKSLKGCFPVRWTVGAPPSSSHTVCVCVQPHVQKCAEMSTTEMTGVVKLWLLLQTYISVFSEASCSSWWRKGFKLTPSLWPERVFSAMSASSTIMWHFCLIWGQVLGPLWYIYMACSVYIVMDRYLMRLHTCVCSKLNNLKYSLVPHNIHHHHPSTSTWTTDPVVQPLYPCTGWAVEIQKNIMWKEVSCFSKKLSSCDWVLVAVTHSCSVSQCPLCTLPKIVYELKQDTTQD